MILTIEQYIEAIAGSEGRFRTLKRVAPVYDTAGTGLVDQGVPLFTVPGHGLVDFEVTVDGIHHTLRCPLRCDAEATLRLRALADRDRGLGSGFFTEWSILTREVVCFDGAGRALEVDILVRPTPQGERFADFLEKATVRGDVDLAAAALRSFEELGQWARNANRGGISRKRLLVAADGTVFLSAFSASDESERIAAELSAVVAGERPDVVFDARASSLDGRDTHGTDEADGRDYGLSGDRTIKCVRDGGGWIYLDHCDRPLSDTVWLSASPFREGRAEVEAAGGKGLIDSEGHTILEAVYEEVVWDEYWGLAAVMAEGRWSLLDRNGILLTDDTYEWLGECCEGLILAQKDGRCGFVDYEGRVAIPFVFDDATSFREGLALVTSGGESFYIDGKGQRI